jgi:hypothetical protein
MKTNTIIEFQGESFSYEDIISKVKEHWTSMGNKKKDLDANIYIKIEEKMIYYVVKEVTYSVNI